MDAIQSLDTTTIIVLIAATAIIILMLFAKAVKGLLKIAVITSMIACMIYFLRQAGII